jgi:hypothetical protein
MKPFIIIAFCGILAVYGQSNETVVEVVNNGNSTEIASVEVPDASVAAVVEPIESKQTVSLQSAENGVNTVIENGSPSTFIASSLVLLFAFINSIQYL